jgi:hypothetical protein
MRVRRAQKGVVKGLPYPDRREAIPGGCGKNVVFFTLRNTSPLTTHTGRMQIYVFRVKFI